MTDITSNLYQLDETLTQLAGEIPPVARRKLMRKIAAYLRTTNRSNITQQKAANGEKWKARKNKKIRKKMLTGYKRRITGKSTATSATIGMFGGVSPVTHTHHEGLEQDGVKYPKRPLVSWNEENHRVIKIMILEALEESFATR